MCLTPCAVLARSYGQQLKRGSTVPEVDIDPLAVLMSRAWVTPLTASDLAIAAREVVIRARKLKVGQMENLADLETQQFIDFWFAPLQRNQLVRLATVLRANGQAEKDALTVALSRIIVSKEMMASLARDTSHSRPHRVAIVNNFDVYDGFLRAANRVAKILAPELIVGNAGVHEGDARRLSTLDDNSFDLVVTSPPYLNAIDYLRGHKLTLVWLGYQMSTIRSKRSESVGAEKTLDSAGTHLDIDRYIVRSPNSTITERHLGWIKRYAADIQAVFVELTRVVKRRGSVVIVVGNSFLRGTVVNNAMLVGDIAQEVGILGGGLKGQANTGSTSVFAATWQWQEQIGHANEGRDCFEITPSPD